MQMQNQSFQKHQNILMAISQKLHINIDKYHLPQFARELVYTSSGHCKIYTNKVPIFLQHQTQDYGKLHRTQKLKENYTLNNIQKVIYAVVLNFPTLIFSSDYDQ
jgi:regulator of sigma D